MCFWWKQAVIYVEIYPGFELLGPSVFIRWALVECCRLSREDKPAVCQLCEVLVLRSSLVLAVLSVLSISLLLNAASLWSKIPPHPTFKASASWACAPQSRAALCCWLSPGLELAPAPPVWTYRQIEALGPACLKCLLAAQRTVSSGFLHCPLPPCLPSTMGGLCTSQPTWLWHTSQGGTNWNFSSSVTGLGNGSS